MNLKKFSFLVFLTVGITLLIALSIGALAEGETPDSFFGEGDFPTYLSLFMLLGIGAMSFMTYLREKKAIWLLVAISFIFLGIDEIAMIHENLDEFIHSAMSIQETPLTDRIDDIIVVIYGLVGLAVLVFNRKEIIKYKEAIKFFLPGFTLIVLMVIFDAVSNREGILVGEVYFWAKAMDEVCKLLAEAFLLVGVYFCYEKNQALYEA